MSEARALEVKRVLLAKASLPHPDPLPEGEGEKRKVDVQTSFTNLASQRMTPKAGPMSWFAPAALSASDTVFLFTTLGLSIAIA